MIVRRSFCGAKVRFPVLLLLSVLLTALFFGMTAYAEKDPNARFRVRVAKWAKDAAITRKEKPLRPVVTGTILNVGDRVTTKLQSVDITSGQIGLQRIKPNSVLRYLSMKPTLLRYGKPAELSMELERGWVQHRVSSLAAPSRYLLRSGGKVTAPRGTAFSIRTVGDRTTILVAQGRVGVSYGSFSDEEIEVAARQKLIVGDTFDAEPVPVNAQDEREVRELLSLPVRNLGGYFSPRELRRKDAENIVALDALRGEVEVDGLTSEFVNGRIVRYSVRWRPNTIAVTAPNNFWTVDAQGRRRNVGRGLYYQASTADASVIIATRPKSGTWRTSFTGAGTQRLTTRLFDWVVLHPLGKEMAGVVPLTRPGQRPGQRIRSGSEWYWMKTLPSTPVRVLTTGAQSYTDIAWLRGRFFAYSSNHGSLAFFLNGKVTELKFPPGLRSLVVSPDGRWALREKTEDTQDVTDLSTGRRFSIATRDELEPLPGRGLILGTDPISGERFTLEPGRPESRRVLAETEEVPLFRRTESSGFGRDITGPFQRLDYSPNGELVTFPEDNLIVVADSQNLRRRSVVGVRVPNIFEYFWLGGNQVVYRSTTGRNSALVLLGVKERLSNAASTGGTSAPTAPGDPTRGLFTFGYKDSGIEVWDRNAAGNMVGTIKGAPLEPFLQAYFVTNAGQVTVISEGQAQAINSKNLVSGLAGGGIENRLFAWSPGNKIELTPEGREFKFGGLAESGEVLAIEGDLGYFWSSPRAGQPRKLTVLPSLSGFRPVHMAPNGLVAGYRVENGNARLLLWNRKSAPRPLSAPLLEIDQARQIRVNSAGQVAGYSSLGDLYESNTFIARTTGEPTIVDRYDRNYVDPVNNSTGLLPLILRSLSPQGSLSGIKFGPADKNGLTDQERFGNDPYVWHKGALIRLNDIAPPGLKVITAGGIDAKGIVFGRGRLNGKDVGFRFQLP